MYSPKELVPYELGYTANTSRREKREEKKKNHA